MVTIEKSPDPVSLAGNPICFTVVGGNALESAPSGKAQATLYFDRELSADDGFYLIVNGTQYRFIVTAYTAIVDDAGTLVLPQGASSMDVVEIAKQLQSHPYLASHFNIFAQSTTDGNIIRLQALDSGRYAMELRFFYLNPDGDETGDVIVTCEQSSQGGIPAIREDYQLHRVCCIADHTGEETVVADDVLSVDNEGRTKGDISEYLQPYFSFEFQYPVETPVHTCPGMEVLYRCHFHESVDGKLTRRSSSDTLLALPGRMSAIDYAIKTNKGESPCDGAGYRFLSNYKGVKTVYPDYPEKLFFLLPEGQDDSYRLKAKAAYRMQQREVVIGTVPGLRRETRIIECNVDYGTVMKAFGNMPDIAEYQVWIERTPVASTGTSEWTKCSEERRFRVNKENPASLHCFFFINAWGVPEVAVLRGHCQTELDITREINEIKGEEAAQSPLSVKMDKNISAGSGYITKEEWEWLCEMQRSLQVFELLPGQILSCTLNNRKSSKMNEFGMYSHEFTYKYAKEGSRAFEGGFSYRYLFDSTFDETFN